MPRHSVFTAIRLLRCPLALAACLAFGPTMRAAAQQAEQITVLAPDSSRPPIGTTTLGASDIARSGTSGLGDLLDQLPAFGSQGINGAQDDGGYGVHFIDLRNLNFNRTLVLVDGKRFVLSGIQTDEAVDLNDIPAAFVDHIEVLQDGSQPQYAADAVAGVVNVVLKDSIEGVHLDAYGGAAGAGDAGTTEISLVGGHGFAWGHVAAGLDVLSRDPVIQSDRSWSADPIASATMTASGPQLVFGSPGSPAGHAVGDGIDSLELGGGRSRPFNPTTDDYDPAPGRYLQGGLQRGTAYVDADAALADDISANVELLFTDRRTTTRQPPQILGLTGTAKHPDGFVIPASDAFNPFGVPVTLERVVSEAGAQTTTTSGPVWRVLGGLDGTRGDWAWSLSFDHGQSLSRYVASNQIDLTRALQTAGDGPCPADTGCVEADWFGPGSLSPRAVQYFATTGRSQSSYTETVGQARIDGPIAPLPGGHARLEVGVEARDEFGATTVSPVTALGDQAGDDAAPTAGGYLTYEGYTRLTLPLLRHVWAADRLTLELSGRATSTSRYGAFLTSLAALEYAPIPGLTFQAVTGTGRRPPAIAEAFGGITTDLQPVTDPCDSASGLRANHTVDANCRTKGLGARFLQASPLIDVESGGNSRLHPEESENETLGMRLTPPRLPFLSASVDYYDYRIRDAIDSLADTDPNLIPDGCYESPHFSSPLCSLITRIAGGGNAGQISHILGLDENVGTIKTDGLDFGLTLTFPATPLGRLRLDWQTNWLLDYRLRTIGQSQFVQYAGTFPGLAAVGSYARIRSRATADLTSGPWSFGWTGRFISGAHVLGASPSDLDAEAPAVFYADIDISRRFGRLTAMAGIDNLADTRPPTLIDGETNTDTSTYDVVGRFCWGRLSYAF